MSTRRTHPLRLALAAIAGLVSVFKPYKPTVEAIEYDAERAKAWAELIENGVKL